MTQTTLAGTTSTTTVEIGGILYENIVSQNYRLNPETEELMYGIELEEGMVVLVEPKIRSDESSAFSDPNNMLRKNRWCMVTNLRLISGERFFIGLYSDGDKQVRRCGGSLGWFVKRDSIPVPKIEMEE